MTKIVVRYIDGDVGTYKIPDSRRREDDDGLMALRALPDDKILTFCC